MKRKVALGVVVALLLCTVGYAVPQTQIFYDTQDLGAGRWEYTFQVVNVSLTSPIEQFTIWFDYEAYDNLVIETPDPPAGNWDEVVWQPEPLLLDDGGYDAKALGAGISVGQSISGFAVSFDWLGVGEPGPQFYQIIDPATFDPIDSGMTVPEPATLLLLGLGGVCLRRRRTTIVRN